MRSFFKELKEFAMRGNVMSLAVGLIIGAAFGEVVGSLTENILSPIIGLFVGQNLSYLQWNVFGINLYYGAFVTSVINFIILAFVVFIMVRVMNKLLAQAAKKQQEDEPQKHLCPFCKTEHHAEATICPACTSKIGV